MPTSLKPVTDPLLRVRSPSHSNYRIIFLVSIFLPCFCSANTALPAQAIRPSRFDGRMENESGAYIASSDDPISALQGGDSSENGISPLPSAEYYEYYTQSGDTLYTVAVRFNAYYSEIKAINGLHLPERGLLSPGQGLRIPKKFATTTDSAHLFPDSEIVFSKTSANFSVENFILGKRGFLLPYTDEEGRTGSEIILHLDRENSINPKILLSLLEYTSGWVTNKHPSKETLDYPMKFPDPYSRGLYRQLMLAINYLEKGYYNWREAKILCLYFNDGETIRLAPDLNAGTVAVLYYFSKISNTSALWEQNVKDFYTQYSGFFGDPAAEPLEPLYPKELYPPSLILPFPIGQSWCFSNGPHGAWDAKGPEAAVDLAPPQDEYSDALSRMLVASASGCVVRSEKNTVVIDLDCDGLEQTGWNIFFYHLSEVGRARAKSKVRQGQKIGYASSAGGVSSGIHVHVALKYNGEWILAGGPIPFSLSRWVLAAGDAAGEWLFLRSGRAVVSSNEYDLSLSNH